MESKLTNLVSFIAVFIAVTLLYLVYIFTFGAKVTNANNLFIEARKSFDEKEFETAEKKINESVELWQTPESLKLQQTINSAK